MNRSVTALAALLAAAVLTPSHVRASTLDFTFAFINPLAPNYSGRVEGVVRGLTDNSVSAARSVEVTFNEDGFGIGEYLGIALENAWRVENGQILGADFRMFGSLNAEAGVPGVTEATLRFVFRNGVQEAGLEWSPMFATSEPVDVVFELRDAHVALVPLPATALLLLGALGGIGLLRRHRREHTISNGAS